MRGLLVRVAADQTEGGGFWNGPADSKTGNFVYVAIPESSLMHPGLNKPYAGLSGPLDGLGAALPPHLLTKDMHLDPDFDHLTYGDHKERARQIGTKVGQGDLLVFYAGMQDVQPGAGLVYAIIGLFFVGEVVPALAVPVARWHENAHTRRVLASGATDIVVRAQGGVSGRLERYLPIGNYRARAYRVWPELLAAWGGLSVNDGYLQRSAQLPMFTDARRFYDWFLTQNVTLLPRNN